MIIEKDGIFGYKRLPKWLKNKYLQSQNNCQFCGKKKNLEIHRIKRGVVGGLYTILPLNHKKNNIKVLCKSCHNKVHKLEFKK
jgi:transcription elongation factor Elf1